MSVEGEVDLDAMIQNDKRQAKIKKTKEIQKQREERREFRKRQQEDFRRRVEQRAKKSQDRSPDRHHKHSHENKNYQKSIVKPSQKSYYAISITGLLSDISIDDICKLLGERKIISIKTVLRNKDRSPVDTKNATLMAVTVVLCDKGEADSFVKLYSEKKLDGKYELAFSFVNPSDQLN